MSTLSTENDDLNNYLGGYFASRLQNAFQLLDKVEHKHLINQVQETISEDSSPEEIALLLAFKGTNDQKQKIYLQMGKVVSDFEPPFSEEDNMQLIAIGSLVDDEAIVKSVIAVKETEDNLKFLGYKLSPNTSQRELLALNLSSNPDLVRKLDSELLTKYLIFDAGTKKARVRLPNSVEQQASFLRVMHESEQRDRPVTVFAPVCPDYSNIDYSLRFGISSTARVTMEAIKKLVPLTEKSGLDFNFHILVADTEDDLPEVLQRLTKGDLSEFQRRTRQSVAEINKEFDLAEFSDVVQVGTFTDYFGDSFRQSQYDIEANIREILPKNEILRGEIIGTSRNRTDKYHLILGHSEENFLLSVRYAAQYAALAYLLKQHDQPTAIMNYTTPNLKYFEGEEYRLVTSDVRPDLPIIEVLF